MTTQCEPGQSIGIASVPNMRDLGGWPTRDGGRCAVGLVYPLDRTQRACRRGHGGVRGAGHPLGLRPANREPSAEPSPIGCRRAPSTSFSTCFEDSADAAPAQLFSVMSDPKAAQEMLGGGKGLTLFEAGYREIVVCSSADAGYRRLFPT